MNPHSQRIEAPFIAFDRWWRAGHMALSPVGAHPHDAEFIWKAAWDAALQQRPAGPADAPQSHRRQDDPASEFRTHQRASSEAGERE